MRIYVICIYICNMYIFHIFGCTCSDYFYFVTQRISVLLCYSRKKIRACIELLFSCLWNEIKGQVLCDKVTAGLLIFGELTSVFAS